MSAPRILVIGTGLIGTSIALGARGSGFEVFLDDPSPTTEALAVDMGAGEAWVEGSSSPDLVVVAAPPDVASGRVIEALLGFPSAIVTDVASVKSDIQHDVLVSGVPSENYVGSHPMAGRARSGAAFADKDLFYGHPWVLVPTERTGKNAVARVKKLAVELGAVPLTMTSKEHDEAVAYVSHVPQLVSSLLASRLLDAPTSALELAGQGLRDTTRIAASDPGLWTAIVAGNAGPIAKILHEIADDLHVTVERLEQYSAGRKAGAVGVVSDVVASGNRGVSRIPGKHGGAQRLWAEIEVLIPDRPGELGRLFSDFGQCHVNIEDLMLEHSAGKKFGLARIMVDPAAVVRAVSELERRGWRVVSSGEGSR